MSEFSPLVICENHAYHHFLHVRMRVRAAGGDPNSERVCGSCQEVKPLAAFVKDTSYTGYRALCMDCKNSDRRSERAA